jgi:hypothetical protein
LLYKEAINKQQQLKNNNIMNYQEEEEQQAAQLQEDIETAVNAGNYTRAYRLATDNGLQLHELKYLLEEDEAKLAYIYEQVGMNNSGLADREFLMSFSVDISQGYNGYFWHRFTEEVKEMILQELEIEEEQLNLPECPEYPEYSDLLHGLSCIDFVEHNETVYIFKF